MSWQLQQANERFSELVEKALDEGPQVVTRHGEDVVVVMSVEEHRKLTAHLQTFKAFLRSGPSLELLELDRPRFARTGVSILNPFEA